MTTRFVIFLFRSRHRIEATSIRVAITEFTPPASDASARTCGRSHAIPFCVQKLKM